METRIVKEVISWRRTEQLPLALYKVSYVLEKNNKIPDKSTNVFLREKMLVGGKVLFRQSFYFNKIALKRKKVITRLKKVKNCLIYTCTNLSTIWRLRYQIVICRELKPSLAPIPAANPRHSTSTRPATASTLKPTTAHSPFSCNKMLMFNLPNHYDILFIQNNEKRK